MCGEIASGGVIPGARDAQAAIDGNAEAGGHADAGCAEIAREAEDIALGRFGKLGGKNGVAGSECEHPGAFRAPARDGDHDADKIGQGEFVAAEEARLNDAVEASG